MKLDKSKVAKLLALLGGACAVGLQVGFRFRADSWSATIFALLYHAALWAAVLSCALAWRHKDPDFRYATRILVLIVLFMWMHTWLEPLQDLVAWVKVARFLWLDV